MSSGRDTEENWALLVASPRDPRIVHVNPFVGRGVTPNGWAADLDAGLAHLLKVELPSGERALTKQADALIVQAFPGPPRIHRPQEVQPIRHSDMTAIW
jgi:hypothetical protein